MNRFAILGAAGLVMALGAADALARDGRDGARAGSSDRGYRGGTAGSTTHHFDRGTSRGDRGTWRGDRNHWRGGYSRPYYGWRGGYPRYSWISPYYWGGYPGWVYGGFYAPPLYSYVDERPYYVERVIEPEPIYVEREPEPPQREYRERSYAQAKPPVEPARPAPPGPPPVRLERYTLSATELFDFDKSTLKLPQPKLDEIAEAMVRNPGIDHVAVTGYTDRIGTRDYNKRLSELRAWSVAQYLIQRGVPENKVFYEGRGDKDPVTRNDECTGLGRPELITCLQKDRRVEVEASIRRKHATVTQ